MGKAESETVQLTQIRDAFRPSAQAIFEAQQLLVKVNQFTDRYSGDELQTGKLRQCPEFSLAPLYDKLTDGDQINFQTREEENAYYRFMDGLHYCAAGDLDPETAAKLIQITDTDDQILTQSLVQTSVWADEYIQKRFKATQIIKHLNKKYSLDPSYIDEIIGDKDVFAMITISFEQALGIINNTNNHLRSSMANLENSMGHPTTLMLVFAGQESTFPTDDTMRKIDNFYQALGFQTLIEANQQATAAGFKTDSYEDETECEPYFAAAGEKIADRLWQERKLINKIAVDRLYFEINQTRNPDLKPAPELDPNNFQAYMQARANFGLPVDEAICVTASGGIQE
jgi:hypothetical protein